MNSTRLLEKNDTAAWDIDSTALWDINGTTAVMHFRLKSAKTYWDLNIGIFVCALGLLLDSFTAMAIIRMKKSGSKRQHTYFLLNVLISDIVIVSAGAVLFSLKLYQFNKFGENSVYLLPTEYFIRQSIVCAQNMALRVWNIGITANLLGLLLMTIDHFIAVRFSLKHQIWMRKKVVFSLISAAWIVSVLRGLTDLFIILAKENKLRDLVKRYGKDVDGFCHVEVIYRFYGANTYLVPLGQKDDSFIKDMLIVIIILTVFVVMAVVYTYIAFVVVRVTREGGNRKKYSQITLKEVNTQIKQQRIKGIGTSVLLMSSFAVLWLPHQIVNILHITQSSVLKKADFPLVISILMVLASCTGIFDVLIYFLRSREFKGIKQKCSCAKASATATRSTQLTSRLTTNTNARL